MSSVLDAGLLKKASPGVAEQQLAHLVNTKAAAIVAVDAPLTLPPCLACPGFCGGPGPEACELTAARDVWSAGGNPMTERLCEVRLRKELDTNPPRPQATMWLGQIAARGVAFARRFAGLLHTPGRNAPSHIIEVYPYGSQHRLSAHEPAVAPRHGKEKLSDYFDRGARRLRTARGRPGRSSR